MASLTFVFLTLIIASCTSQNYHYYEDSNEDGAAVDPMKHLLAGYNITGLEKLNFPHESKDIDDFKAASKSAMRNAIGRDDENFDDYNDEADPETWTIFISQILPYEIDGALDLDIEMVVYPAIIDVLLSNQRGETGFFKNNMESFYQSYFNNSNIRFSVDIPTIHVKSASSSFA